MKKCTKWAAITITATILLMLVRGCAPKWGENTNAHQTNNQTPAYNYSEYFENIDEQMDKITGVEQSKGLNK
ncbi:MAG: hypothetical protein E7171_06215 [Firmicutes bacterium]|nr:hypothetical protein [Bacillota bacterium]